MNIELTTKLNYVFKNPALLEMALTHRSKGGDHNERLEFLGDAVVNFVVAEMLYLEFPKASEGELSRYRASLVNRSALAEMAALCDLGKYVILGPGEIKSGGSERASILSCTMEAIIGAIYLDGGYDAVRDCLGVLYQPLLLKFSNQKSHKDPKTLLQEYLQSHHFPLPVYTVENIEGEAHQQYFTIQCEVEGLAKKTIGQGSNRRQAEQEAAKNMLIIVKK